MRQFVSAGTPWGDIVGYSRAVRAGNLIFVSGTTATGPEGTVLHPNQPGPQARVIFERIGAALKALGASLNDVVETRIYICDIQQWEAVGRVHGEVFQTARPATAMVEVSRLIDPAIAVEISAIAVAPTSAPAPTPG
jgi:enamine deaminase RidA (YjgF/YER057c/UK114 family)